MGKAREQEVRLTMAGVVALMAVAALLLVLAAVSFGGKWHGTVSGISGSQDRASAVYELEPK